jgi:hypothetical protein
VLILGRTACEAHIATPKLFSNNRVPTSQQTLRFHDEELISVYCDNHTEHANSVMEPAVLDISPYFIGGDISLLSDKRTEVRCQKTDVSVASDGR